MAQTTEMKKRKFTKVFALLLAMVMVLALPVEASAAAKVTAVTKETKAKAVKKGKTVVTLPKATKKSSTYSYVKFKAPATKTYKITLGNLRKRGRSSASDILATHSSLYKNGYYGLDRVTIKLNKKKTDVMYICSAYSWSISKSYTKKITANTFLPSRTASVKLKKGETLYIGMGNIERTKLCLDLTIK